MPDADIRTYQLGWNDGYAEGYACKLADATSSFQPSSLDRPEAVERVANYVARKYSAHFSRMDALGLARAMIRVATSDDNTPDLDRRPQYD